MSGKEIEQPLSMSPEDIEPGRIKFFGVCHIVFGSLGLMNVAYGIVMQFLREPLFRVTQTGGPDRIQEIQNVMYRDLAVSNWINIGMSLVVGILILRAGIALTKRRQSSVRLSNAYALSSLIAKAIGILVFLLLTLPVIGGALTAMLAESNGALPEWTERLPVLIGAIGVGGFLLSTIYPLCTFVMLNKDNVRQHLAKHGT